MITRCKWTLHDQFASTSSTTSCCSTPTTTLDRWLPISLLLHIRGSFAKHTRYSTSYASSNRRFYTKRKMNHKVARYIIHDIGTTLAAVTDDFFTFAHMRHYVNRTETALGARTCTGAPIHVVCRSSTRQNPYSHVSSLHIFALRYRCAHVYTEKGCWIQGAVHTPHHDHMATDTYDNTSLRLKVPYSARTTPSVGTRLIQRATYLCSRVPNGIIQVASTALTEETRILPEYSDKSELHTERDSLLERIGYNGLVQE